MKRWAACALLRIAVSGWFSSCASDAASSPMVEMRVTCASCWRLCWSSESACLRSVMSVDAPRI